MFLIKSILKYYKQELILAIILSILITIIQNFNPNIEQSYSKIHKTKIITDYIKKHGIFLYNLFSLFLTINEHAVILLFQEHQRNKAIKCAIHDDIQQSNEISFAVLKRVQQSINNQYVSN